MAGKRLTFAQFAASPIVSYSSGLGSARAAIDTWLQENGQRKTHVARSDGSFGVKTLALAPNVAAMVVAAAVEDEVRSGTLEFLDI